MDLSVTVEDVTVSPSSVARNLGVILGDCPVPLTSLLWPDPADLPSTTSTGFGLSSQKMQRNSWYKRWSPPAWTTETPSRLDSQPLVEWTPDRCQDSGITLHLNPSQDSLTSPRPHIAWLPPPKFFFLNVCTCIISTSIISLMHLQNLWQIAVTILRWGLDNYFYVSFTLSKVMCWGFSLVTNVLIVSRFGQKYLLNALNVNVNVNKLLSVSMFCCFEQRTVQILILFIFCSVHWFFHILRCEATRLWIVLNFCMCQRKEQ